MAPVRWPSFLDDARAFAERDLCARRGLTAASRVDLNLVSRLLFGSGVLAGEGLLSPSHGENRGSSPLGSANDSNNLAEN